MKTILAGALALVASAAQAQDIQPNRSAAAAVANDAYMVRAERCVRGQTSRFLSEGLTSKTQIIDRVAEVCMPSPEQIAAVHDTPEAAQMGLKMLAAGALEETLSSPRSRYRNVRSSAPRP